MRFAVRLGSIHSGPFWGLTIRTHIYIYICTDVGVLGIILGYKGYRCRTVDDRKESGDLVCLFELGTLPYVRIRSRSTSLGYRVSSNGEGLC